MLVDEIVESRGFRGVVFSGSGITDGNGEMVGESYPPCLMVNKSHERA